MHIHGNDASDKESLESCYCEIILHVFPGNHKVRACLRVRVSVSIWQGARLKKKLTYSSTHRHPLEVWVGATKRNLQSMRAPSHPVRGRRRRSIAWI